MKVIYFFTGKKKFVGQKSECSENIEFSKKDNYKLDSIW